MSMECIACPYPEYVAAPPQTGTEDAQQVAREIVDGWESNLSSPFVDHIKNDLVRRIATAITEAKNG